MWTAGAKLLLLAIVIPLIAACSGVGTSPRSDAELVHPASPREFVEFMRATVSFDFDPATSPEALRQTSDIAGLGRVRSVREAWVRESAGPRTGAVLVELDLDEAWGSGGPVAGDHVYVLLRRPSNLDASVFKESLPVGTRIALFGYRSTLELETVPELQTFEPDPQGLMIEESGGILNVWGAEVNKDYPLWDAATTIDRLRSSLNLGRKSSG